MFGRICGVAVWTAMVCGQAEPTPTTLPPNLLPGLYAVIHTSMGTITAELFEKDTPNTVRNFIGLAQGKRPWLDPKSKQPTTRPLYEHIMFHRVIPNFMIQTGDPTGTGTYNCGFVMKDEIVPTLKFDRPGRQAYRDAVGHYRAVANEGKISSAKWLEDLEKARTDCQQSRSALRSHCEEHGC